MSKNNNVISFETARQLRQAEKHDGAYRSLIEKMSKIELLEEMVRFQEERTRVGKLTLGMIVRGRILFRELEKGAETQELRLLTRSYRRHLEFELRDHFSQKTQTH